jgi:hypothetical protein
MYDMRILIANDPRSYREVIAAAVQELRPQHSVVSVAPDDVDREICRFKPHLVVCSHLGPAVEANALAWIMLYPGGQTRSEFSIAGQRTAVADIEFSDLLAIVDRTQLLTAGR